MKKSVAVSLFKAKLSAYLRRVKRGDELIIEDHNVPVARVIPYENERVLNVRAADKPFAAVRQLKFTRLHGESDSLAALSEERRER